MYPSRAAITLFSLLAAFPLAAATPSASPLRKVREVAVYSDPLVYASFPSVVRRPDGELIVAFRRAPARKAFGEPGESHADPSSHLVQVRSRDGGLTWDAAPALIYAHAFGGAQDPCLLQLRDSDLLCASYGWAFVQPEVVPRLRQLVHELKPGVIFLGGFLVRSGDGGRTWQGPTYPPHIAPELLHDLHGRPLPAYNRGALAEARDGRLFWVVAANDRLQPKKTSCHLLVSSDRGVTWAYTAPVAVDEKVTFNEASILETPRGDLVAFLRTAGLDDHAVMARSTDGGKTFQPWQDLGWRGHPLQATRLSDGRVLLVYGYRHKPYGVRARVLDPECRDAATAPEFVIRDDGGSTDLGYPWAVPLENGRALVVYYFNRDGGPRHIAATILEVGR